MPIVEVERPDGGIDELDLPDEMSPETVQATVKRHVASFQQPSSIGRLREMERDIGRTPKSIFSYTPEEQKALFERIEKEGSGFGEGMVGDGGAMYVKPPAWLVRSAIPAYAAILTGGASIPAQMAAGALGSMAGEVGGQIAEAPEGQPTRFKPGQIAGAGIAGAAPVAPAKALFSTARTMASQGLGGAAGSIAEQAIDKGDVSGIEAAARGGQAAGLSAIPAAIGGVASWMGGKLAGAIPRGEAIEEIGKGVEPTLEQMFPGVAPVGRRLVERAGEGMGLRGVLQTQNEKIGQAIGNLVGGGPIENPNVVGSMILRGIGESPELARDFQAANERLRTLADAMDNAKDTAQRARLQVEFDQLRQQGKATVARALGINNLDDFESVTAGMKVGADIEGALGAYKARAAELYGPVKEVLDQRLFDAAPLVDEANKLMAKIPSLRGLGNFSKLIRRSEAEAKAMGIPQPDYYASLEELRGMAGELWDVANDPNVAIGDNAQRILKDFAGKIRATIDQQAPSAIGQDLADQLKDANAFWAKYRPRFSQLGIREAFMGEGEKIPKIAAQIAQDVMSEGTATSKYNNVVTLFKDMARDGVPNVPTTTELNTAMRQAIVARARDPLTRGIDFEKLAPIVKEMEVQSPGTAAKIGFGSVKELEEFAKRVGQLREVPGKQIAQITKLIDEGNKAGMWAGVYAMNRAPGNIAINRLEQVADRKAIMDALRARSANGSKPATEAIRSAQMSFMDETFDLSAQGRINPDEALQRWYAAVKDGTAETMLGAPAVKVVNDKIVPGLKAIGEAFLESKGVGGWSKGMQVTAAANVGRRTAEQVMQGNVIKGAIGMTAGSALEIGYDLLAKVIVRGAGVSGLRSNQATLRVIEKLASMPKAAAMAAAYRYAETGEEPR